jgi:hypothetical protein
MFSALAERIVQHPGVTPCSSHQTTLTCSLDPQRVGLKDRPARYRYDFMQSERLKNRLTAELSSALVRGRSPHPLANRALQLGVEVDAIAARAGLYPAGTAVAVGPVVLEDTMPTRTVVWILTILAIVLVAVPLLGMLGMMGMGGMMGMDGMMGGNMMGMGALGLIWVLLAAAVVIALVVVLVGGVSRT